MSIGGQVLAQLDSAENTELICHIGKVGVHQATQAYGTINSA